MNPGTPLDRIRAWIEGDLAPDEIAQLERELARDPALAAFAAEYRAVRALTAFAERIPRTSTDVDELMQRIDREEQSAPRIRSRRVAVAAAMLLTLGGAALLRSAFRSDERGPVQLERIVAPEAFASAPVEPVPVPARLASWSPVRDGEIQWLSDLDEARAAASATGRLVFVFGSLPGCEWCASLRATTFVDPSVLRAAEEYVPVEVDLASAPAALRDELMKSGYPVMLVQSAEGKWVRKLSGMPPLDEVLEPLWSAIEEHDPERELPDWDEVHELAALSLRAEQAERDGRLGDAWNSFERIAELAVEGLFARNAATGCARIARGASELLVELAQTPGDALTLLEPALARYSGTPFEPDLERVHAALERGDGLADLRFAPR